jgi:hypothetical protein
MGKKYFAAIQDFRHFLLLFLTAAGHFIEQSLAIVIS